MNLKKIIAIVAVSGIVIAGIVVAYVYVKAFTPNTTFNQKEVFVYIPTNATYEQAKEELSPFIKDMDKFDFVAKQRKYFSNVKAGKFLLTIAGFAMVFSTSKDVRVDVLFASYLAVLFAGLISNYQQTLRK